MPKATMNPTLVAWKNGLIGAQPSAALLTALNNYFNSISTEISKHDLLAIQGGMETSEQALRPFVTTGATPFTTTNTLVTAGLQGGSGTYTNTKWKPFTHGVKYTQNDACIYAYNNIVAALGDNHFFGAWDGGSKYVGLAPGNFSSQANGSINSGLYEFNVAVTSCAGIWRMERTGVNVSKLYQDTTLMKSSVIASTALVDFEIYCNSINISNVSSYAAGGVLGMIGAGSSSIDKTVIYNAWQTYKTARGF